MKSSLPPTSSNVVVPPAGIPSSPIHGGDHGGLDENESSSEVISAAVSHSPESMACMSHSSSPSMSDKMPCITTPPVRVTIVPIMNQPGRNIPTPPPDNVCPEPCVPEIKTSETIPDDQEEEIPNLEMDRLREQIVLLGDELQSRQEEMEQRIKKHYEDEKEAIVRTCLRQHADDMKTMQQEHNNKVVSMHETIQSLGAQLADEKKKHQNTSKLVQELEETTHALRVKADMLLSREQLYALDCKKMESELQASKSALDLANLDIAHGKEVIRRLQLELQEAQEGERLILARLEEARAMHRSIVGPLLVGGCVNDTKEQQQQAKSVAHSRTSRGRYTKHDLEAMTVKQLQKILKSQNKKVGGIKSQLVRRVLGEEEE